MQTKLLPFRLAHQGEVRSEPSDALVGADGLHLTPGHPHHP